MNFWHSLGTLITAIVLIGILMHKDVTTPEGTPLGTVSDVELDYTQDKIWIIVNNEGRWIRIPENQIVKLADRVTITEDWTNAC